jgi:hypothetical protein
MSDSTTPHDSAAMSPASAGSQREAIERLLRLARKSHYYCEDSWYSCPLAEYGCADDSYPKDECNCGADERNAEVDAIAATLRPLLDRLS